jgi:hypothetical protein
MNSYPPGFLREVKLELNSVARSAPTYRRYLNLMHGWASSLESRPRRLGLALSFASRIVRLSFDGTSPRTNNR